MRVSGGGVLVEWGGPGSAGTCEESEEVLRADACSCVEKKGCEALCEKRGGAALCSLKVSCEVLCSLFLDGDGSFDCFLTRRAELSNVGGTWQGIFKDEDDEEEEGRADGEREKAGEDEEDEEEKADDEAPRGQ